MFAAPPTASGARFNCVAGRFGGLQAHQEISSLPGGLEGCKPSKKSLLRREVWRAASPPRNAFSAGRFGGLQALQEISSLAEPGGAAARPEKMKIVFGSGAAAPKPSPHN